MILVKNGSDPKNCDSKTIWPKIILDPKNIQPKNLSNKPSFCSGSCDEWHAKKNRTTLKLPHKSFKLLPNTLKIFLKLPRNFYERSFKLL